ncbi:MFS transporter [Aureimonas phyllosphaerae]|uniref:MFS transporter n=1 Tax=Aureimonas phyllosphaerae TaxID=1166078 RepID=UPI003A5C42EB
MQSEATIHPTDARTHASSWSSVLALSLGAFTLIACEFMPVSLLTPIASDLGVTDGMAGRAIAVSGGFAVLTSLLLPSFLGRIDRRLLMLGLTGLMIVSATIAAIAPNYAIFMIGRAFVGVAIGGFWSLSAATVMRLVPDDQVPKALAVLNGGNALATIVAAPLGSFLGGLIGWRGAFFFVVPIAVSAFLWLWLSLPALEAPARTGGTGILSILRRKVVVIGMLGVGLLFMGQFALYTYVRPFLETVLNVDVALLSLILLAIGIAGFVGTALIGFVLDRRLHATLAAIPLLMASVAAALVIAGTSMHVVVSLLILWGFLATAAPVGWWTWLARTLPDDAEAGGGLMVAVVQLAITLGATVGGMIFDGSGYQATFIFAAAILVASAIASMAASRSAR